MRTAPALEELARLLGVQLSYQDGLRRRRRPSQDALLATVRALGLPLERPEDAADALRAERLARASRAVEPVIVVWDGNPVRFELRVPAGTRASEVCLALEDGEDVRWPVDASAAMEEEVDGVRYEVREIVAPTGAPAGYHRLSVEAGGTNHEALVISAPRRAWRGNDERTWGIFLPLYAVRSKRNWGAGDLSDLDELLAWVSSLGGTLVATLPLLATFLERPLFEPSPYSPVSRLFWNELYLDVERAPELPRSAAALDLVGSPGFREEIERLRSGRMVDYEGLSRLKRSVLQLLAEELRTGESDRRAELERFLAGNPAAIDYARFRAACERNRAGWRTWPAPQRDGELSDDDVDGQVVGYHSYVQFLAHEQLESIGASAVARGAGLYLDFPLGVHPEGYDAWRRREYFATEAAGGAPPDSFFTAGQNWAFPPLHPQRIREHAYAYPIACLRALLRYANVLRIDHVMSLHRMYWIPEGVEATDGTYVRYEPEEWYAILALESQRHRALVVGEDLGTVPSEVRTAMGRHEVLRSYVVVEEFTQSLDPPLKPVPARSFATLNTHDMPPFAAFWSGDDIDERREMGLLDGAGVAEERDRRGDRAAALARWVGLPADGAAPQDVAEALLVRLAESPGQVVLAPVEDLWGERERHNTPGTTDERPNWRRKTRPTFEELCEMQEVVGPLTAVDRARRAR